MTSNDLAWRLATSVFLHRVTQTIVTEWQEKNKLTFFRRGTFLRVEFSEKQPEETGCFTMQLSSLCVSRDARQLSCSIEVLLSHFVPNKANERKRKQSVSDWIVHKRCLTGWIIFDSSHVLEDKIPNCERCHVCNFAFSFHEMLHSSYLRRENVKRIADETEQVTSLPVF